MVTDRGRDGGGGEAGADGAHGAGHGIGQDMHEAMLAGHGVPWALVGVLCMAGAAFALVGARGAMPDNDVPASWLPPVVMLVAQLVVLGVADHALLAHAPLRDRAPVAAAWGAFIAGACAAWSCGPTLMWITTAFGTTMDRTLALFLAFAAVDLNAAMMAYLSRGRMVRRLQTMLAAAAATGAIVGPVAVALLDAPATLSCALLSAGGLLAITVMPNLLVHVPDEYLLEWRRHMTRRWTVRGAIPRESRPLRESDVSGDLAVMFASVGEGTMLALIFATCGYAALCVTMPEAPTPIAAAGFAAYTVSAALVLLLRPRTAGNPLERVLMRVAAVSFIALAFVRIATSEPWRWLLPWLIVAMVAVGVLMAAIMPVLDSPFHSILLSRIGDWATSLGLAFALPCAMLAAGAWEMVRGMMA